MELNKYISCLVLASRPSTDRPSCGILPSFPCRQDGAEGSQRLEEGTWASWDVSIRRSEPHPHSGRYHWGLNCYFWIG